MLALSGNGDGCRLPDFRNASVKEELPMGVSVLVDLYRHVQPSWPGVFKVSQRTPRAANQAQFGLGTPKRVKARGFF